MMDNQNCLKLIEKLAEHPSEDKIVTEAKAEVAEKEKVSVLSEHDKKL